jgi:hypothetical protein
MSKSSSFNSVEYQKFLEDNNAFLKARNERSFSRSDSLNSNIFKSKDSFSNLFDSNDISNMAISDSQWKEDLTSIPNVPEDDLFRSKEWTNLKDLGKHVDVSYSPSELFQSEAECDSRANHHSTHTEVESTSSSPLRTNWRALFYSQLHPPATSESEEAVRMTATTDPIHAPHHQKQKSTTKRPKRAYKPKHKREFSNKTYVDRPTDLDVLLGRGGKSNHFPGNKRYREEIKNFKSSYLALGDKDAKTDKIRFVLDYVHQYKGRFLALDKDCKPPRYYVVPDSVARKKVSQALREECDPIKLAEKRARHKNKKAGKKGEHC